MMICSYISVPAIRIIIDCGDENPVHSTTVLCIDVVAKTDTVDFS